MPITVDPENPSNVEKLAKVTGLDLNRRRMTSALQMTQVRGRSEKADDASFVEDEEYED